MSDKFLKAIGKVESGNNPSAKNKETSATGEHQFMWSEWNDEIKKFAGNPNLTRDDFANNPELQNKWASHYVSNVLDPEVKKLKTRFPEQLKKRGLENDDDIRALLHFRGYPDSSSYVRTGQEKQTKEMNLSIPEYIDKFRQTKTESPRLFSVEEKRKKIKERMKSKPVEKKPIDSSWVDDLSKLIVPEAQAYGGAGFEPLPAYSEKDEPEIINSRSLQKSEELDLIPSTEQKDEELDLIPSSKVEAPEVKPAPKSEPKTSQLEAASRGLAQGITFGFADELTAAAESTLTGKPYSKAVEESRAGYETASKEFPKTSFAGEFVGGAGSALIPGVGALGRAAQIAKAGTAAAKTGQMIRGGAQLGALAGLGATEDIANIPQAARDIGVAAATGGAVGGAIGKASQKIAESPAAQKAIGAVSEGAASVRDRLIGKSTKFKFPELTPEKQARVDELVAAGKQNKLADRQILNDIAVEFQELSPDALEAGFREKGIRGKLQRGIAGSEEATEFMSRPEQMKYAEEATRGKTTARALQEADVAAIETRIGERVTEKELLKRQSQDLTQELKDRRLNLQEKWQTADIKERQRLDGQMRQLDQAEAKVKGLIDQRQKVINQYAQADKEIADTVKIELEKAARSKSDEAMEGVARVANELDERVQQIAQQRKELVDSLMDVPATEAELRTAANIRRELQNTFMEQGLGREGDQALGAAFGGDSRFQKVKRYFDIQKLQDDFDANPSAFPEGRPSLSPNDIPSMGELVGAMYSANQKISSAAMGTPMASVKRRIGEVIQEGMGELSPEAYAIQRHLGTTKSNLETIRGSTLFETRKVPVVGKTGRTATVQKRFIKTELPKDVTKWNKDYQDTVQSIVTRERGPVLEEAARLQTAAKEGLPTKVSPRIGELETDIGRLEGRIGQLANERKVLLDAQKAKQPDIALARQEDKRGMIKEGIRSKLDIRNRLRQIDDEVAKIDEQLSQQKGRLQQIGETESQLTRTLQETQGIPASLRDVGQAAVIGAQGKVPFAFAKILLPSPQTRIKAYNRIKNNFANPSLNAAVRNALERPVTMEVVRSLAMTHKVSEPELMKTLQESGVELSEPE
jgi:hypothetical protein